MRRDTILCLFMSVVFILSPMAGCLESSDDKNDASNDYSEISNDGNVTSDYENKNTSDDNNNVTNNNLSANYTIELPKDPFVEFQNDSLLEDDVLLLIAPNGGDFIELINKQAEVIHNWTVYPGLGNDFQLLPNGDILAMLKQTSDKLHNLNFGGWGGVIQIIGLDSEIKWSYDRFSNDTAMAHHDVEMLPNGNVLIMVWELLNCSIAIEMGIDCQTDLAYESLYEVNITTSNVVWEWRSIDHMVQDRYPDKQNYGNITENKQKIDFNFNVEHPSHGSSGDIMHANGIDYDEENELIYLSVNFYNEVWVIDHSTNTDQAASPSGGNFGKGGDLVYRFGNSEAYQSNESIIFVKNHYPNLIEDSDKLGFGNILVYSNGGEQTNNVSTVFELSLNVSDYHNMTPPAVVWSFSNESLYCDIVSGAERGLNNNTYIAEGDYGVWEVTQSGEVAWKLFYGKTWRAYVYYFQDEGVINLLQHIE